MLRHSEKDNLLWVEIINTTFNKQEALSALKFLEELSETLFSNLAVFAMNEEISLAFKLHLWRCSAWQTCFEQVYNVCSKIFIL